MRHSSSISSPPFRKRTRGAVDSRSCTLTSVHVEQYLPAGREPEPDQVLHHLLLPVHHDRAPAGQVGKVDAVPAPVEAQLYAAMNEPLAAHALARAARFEEIHGALLQHARAHAALDVVAAADLDDDRLDALQVQEMGQQQPGGSGADDGDLGVDAHEGPSVECRGWLP